MQTPAQPPVASAAANGTTPASSPAPAANGDPAPDTAFVDIPKDVYEDALDANRIHDFTKAIHEARRPLDPPAPVTPTMSPRMIEQRDAEMAAGAAAVERAAAAERKRRAIRALQHADPRQNPGSTTEVFRPRDYVPDPKKGQGTGVGGTAANL